jgi:hypothetical protein
MDLKFGWLRSRTRPSSVGTARMFRDLGLVPNELFDDPKAAL